MTSVAAAALVLLAVVFSSILIVRAEEQATAARTRRSFRLRFPRGLEQSAVLAFLQGLSGVLVPSRRRLLGWPAVVFEVRADDDGISHWLHVPDRWNDYVLGQLRGAVPSIRIAEANPPQLAINQAKELRLRRGHVPLRVEHATAVAASLLAALHPLARGESMVMQWVVSPALVDRPSKSELAPDEARDVLAGREPLPPLTHAERTKLAEPLFLGVGRLGVKAASPARSEALLLRLTSAFEASRSLEARLVRRLLPAGLVRERLKRGFQPVLAFPGVINSVELGALAAWPMGTPILPGLVLGGAQELPPPPNIPTQGLLLGTSSFPGAERPIAISPADLTRHLLGCRADRRREVGPAQQPGGRPHQGGTRRSFG